ncbi:DNA-binding HxlR family transcriptional regulator [Bradyrhizobium japonicum]
MDFFDVAPILFAIAFRAKWMPVRVKKTRQNKNPTRGGDDMAKANPARICPVAAFQKMISGKYKLRIVWDLKDGPRRYGEIRSGLLRGTEGSAEIAPRVLSRELKALTQSGLIDRKDFGEVPPKVEYRLTRKGNSFVPVVAAIRDWGDRHLTETATLVDAAE